MFIVTDFKNKIIALSTTIDYESNGNVLLDDNTGIAAPCIKGVFEVENIPENIVAEKYCYTEEKGFYINENYVEPVNEKTELEKLQKQVTNLQIALAELVEGGTL